MTRLLILLTLILAASTPRPAHDYPTPNGTPDRGRTGASPRLSRPSALSGRSGNRTVSGNHPTRRAGLLVAGYSSASGDRKPLTRELVRGIASWYPATGMIAAAGPALRVGDWRGSTVTVCAERCVRVTLSDVCQCYAGTDRERIIDLSDDAFRALAPLSRGLVRVTVGA